jgi:hypothetical protein
MSSSAIWWRRVATTYARVASTLPAKEQNGGGMEAAQRYIGKKVSWLLVGDGRNYNATTRTTDAPLARGETDADPADITIENQSESFFQSFYQYGRIHETGPDPPVLGRTFDDSVATENHAFVGIRISMWRATARVVVVVVVLLPQILSKSLTT